MGRITGRVVKVEHNPLSKAMNKVTIIVAKKKYWLPPNEEGEFHKAEYRVHKPVRFEVFVPFWPEIGELITAKVY
jgi:hypothetical protein